MSDLGNDLGQAILNSTAKVMEQASNIIKHLLSLLSKDYEKKIAKLQYEGIKKKNKLSKASGYVGLKKLQESGYDLTYAKSEMTKEQLNKFLIHAKKRGIPISYISNGKDESGRKTYLAVFRTMDAANVKDICDQMIRNTKIENIEKIMDEDVGYRKKNFESSIESVDGKIIDKNSPVVICERTNPDNHIKVTGIQEEYTDGTSYVASHYELYKNGEKQKCEEFKHGEFIHNCDGEGHNSSSIGETHWENMKQELLTKGEFSDDLLIFNNVEDYEKYLSSYKNNREQVEKKSELYDELNAEKIKVIKDDVDRYNEKQANSLFEEISGVAKNSSMTFRDTVDHFQIDKGQKKEPYYICRRTDPNNYIEVKMEQKTDENGQIYNEHTYNVYVDDVKVSNPHREDGKFVDGRWEDMPENHWKDIVNEMQKAGEFDNDCVVFVDKNDYMMYRQIYQQEHAQIKDPTMNFETNKDGLRNDFGYVQNYIESCKKDIESFNDIGSYSDGTWTIKEKEDFNDISSDIKFYEKNKVRIEEANVVAKQINNYQSMVTTANELVAEKSKLELLEKSNLRDSDFYREQSEKIENKTKQLKEMQITEEKLWKNREQITGVKSEMHLRREKISETTEKTKFSEKELREFAKTFKENKTTITRESKVRNKTEKER